MSKFHDKDKSLTYVKIYMKSGEDECRASRFKEDNVSKDMGMKGLKHRFILGKYKGQYTHAIIFDNKTKLKLEYYNKDGIRTKIYSYD